MEITEVRVKLVESGRDKLRAFCSITIDEAFVVRDLKIIDGTKGLFVAMPSRKLTSRCPRCGFKNQVRSNYCNDCGKGLPEESGAVDGRAKVHADIAHPIHSECREQLQARVVEAYEREVEASRSPDYRPRDLDDFEDIEPPEERRPVLATGDAEESPGGESAPSSSATLGPVRDLDRDPRAIDRPAPRPAQAERPAQPTPRGGGGRDLPPPEDNFAAGIF